MRELLTVAQQIGYEVFVADICDEPDLLGYCVPEERLIVVRSGLSVPQLRSTLAHEIGHAWHGHGCDSVAEERQAYSFAARLLIDRARYDELAQHHLDREQLAAALEVTPTILDWYRATVLPRPLGAHYARRRAQIAAARATFRRTA